MSTIKREESISLADLKFIRNELLNSCSIEKDIDNVDNKLKNLSLMAAQSIIPEELKNLYKKYPFILGVTWGIELKNIEGFVGLRKFYYYNDRIILPEASANSLDLLKYKDKIPEYILKEIYFCIGKLDELWELKQKIIGRSNDILTYGDIELYEPDIFIKLQEEYNSNEKEELRKLKEKIKEAIN